MRCEISHCSKDAVRPVMNDYGTCSWRCAKHGKGRKTYWLYRPRPTALDEMAAIGKRYKWWEYAYEDDLSTGRGR